MTTETTKAFTAALSGDDAWRSLKAKLQRRDRYGKFAEMGGGFSFNLRLGNGDMRRVSGKIVGLSGDEDLDVEVKDSDTLPDDTYSVPSQKGEAVSAILSKDALKNVKKENVREVADDVFVDVEDLKIAKKKKKQPKQKATSKNPLRKNKNPFRRNNKTARRAVKDPPDAALAFADKNGRLEQRSVPKDNVVIDPSTGGEMSISSQKIANSFVKNGGALSDVPDMYVIKAINSNMGPRGRFNVIGEGGGVNGMTRMIDTATGAYIGMKYEQGESTSFTVPEADHTPALYKEALNEIFSELVAEEFSYEPMPMRLVKSENGIGVALITELAQNRWGKIDTPQNPNTWDQVDGSLLADLYSYAQMRVFDSLIGNVDRHAGNYLLKKKSDDSYELIPIDHSLTMMQVHANTPIHIVHYYEELSLIDYNLANDEQKYEEFLDALGELLGELQGINVGSISSKLNQVLDHLETMFPNEELYKKSHRAAELTRMLGTLELRIKSMLEKTPEELFTILTGKTPNF